MDGLIALATFVVEEVIVRMFNHSISYLFKWRKTQILRGVRLEGLDLNLNYDNHPILGLQFALINHSTANIEIRKLTLVLQSGQWEFMRLGVIPEIDTSLPKILKNRHTDSVNVSFMPPIEWWLEVRSNINIKSAFLEGQSIWGAVVGNVELHGCSVTKTELDNIGSKYLARVRLRE